MRRILLTLGLLLMATAVVGAQAASVKTVKDEKGWKIQVDGVDFAVKGVVWDDSPIGENYTYDLFRMPEDYITKVIDTDMTLLKAMGVNTIRSFTTIPPRWVEYIYDRYGIYSMVNDLFGRYGITVDGKWQFPTDYSNPATRRTLLAQAQKTFETYKDTKGVLMYMLGNESNYGLDWSSAAVENLPAGERSSFKAKSLYSIFEEAIALGKKIDPNRPMGLINGDLSYLRIIKEQVPSLDILGVNTYRGPQSYAAFYNSIAKDLDRPFVYTEFGADSYNVASEQEDQDAQARLIQSQWREVYDQSYGKGRAANCLGGYVFQWMDGWSKSAMDTVETFNVHDTAATWSNGGYTFDSVAGKNNMNEEWFGLVGQSKHSDSGVARRLPRTAYYLLKDLWTLDLYSSTKEQVAKKFDSLNFSLASIQGNLAQLRDNTTDPNPLLVPTGSVTLRSYYKGNDKSWGEKGTSSLTNANQATLLAGFNLRGPEGLTGSFTLRVLPSAMANTPGMDWMDPVESAAPLSSVVGKTNVPLTQVDLYKATINYQSPELKATVHYHDGHADWVNEGDFFGMLPEAWDLFNPDKEGSRNPFGIEVNLPQAAPDIKVYAGPELYWGASPRVMTKYFHNFGGFSLGFLHDEEVAVKGSALRASQTANRWTSAYGDLKLETLGRIEAGALLARYNQVGDATHTYNFFDGTNLVTAQTFGWLDALAGKVRLSTDAVPYLRASVQYLYAGPLASTRGGALREGSQIADVGTGNRQELLATVNPYFGDFNLRTQFLFRQPLVDALNGNGYTGSPRNPLDDEFIVYDNRKTLAAEAVLTWDRAGATFFHDWNNVDREESPLSASLGLLYNLVQGPTDATYFYMANGSIAKFTTGLPEVSGTWSLQAKASGRPAPGTKMAFTVDGGLLQSTGQDNRLVEFWKGSGKVAVGRVVFEGGFALNAWGPPGWNRTFNITYPNQWNLGVAYGFKPISFLSESDRIGVRISARGLDQYSTAGTEGTLFASGVKERFEAELYAGWTF